LERKLRKIQGLECDWPREITKNDAVIFGCVDRRFRGWKGKIGKHFGLDMSYPILIPGGPKDLVYEDPIIVRYLIKKIGLLVPHIRKELFLVMHNECLACGESKDIEYYKDTLRKAGALLSIHFPELPIRLIFLDFNEVSIVRPYSELTTCPA
jgi:hypothetical protein